MAQIPAYVSRSQQGILCGMQPNEKTIEEFMRLYEAEFGEELTQEEAVEIWTRVMDIYLLLYHASDDKVRTRETTRDSLRTVSANR